MEFEYEAWQEQKEKIIMKSRGLGDDIKKITSATRLDQLAKRIAELTNSDCGCDRRQEKLNKLFPYNNRKGNK
jgi:hypothetical protein